MKFKNANEKKAEVKPTILSWTQMRGEQGIYRQHENGEDERFVVTFNHDRVGEAASCVSVLLVNKKEKTILAANEPNWKDSKFVKTDDELFMEIK